MWFSFSRRELAAWSTGEVWIYFKNFVCPKQAFSLFLMVLLLVTARQSFQIYRRCSEGLFLYLWLDIYITFFREGWQHCLLERQLLCAIRKAKHTITAFCPAKALPVCCSLWLFLYDCLITFMLEFSLDSEEKRGKQSELILLFIRKTKIRGERCW